MAVVIVTETQRKFREVGCAVGQVISHPGEHRIHRVSHACGFSNRTSYGGTPRGAIYDQLQTERITPGAIYEKSFLGLLQEIHFSWDLSNE